MSSPEPRTHGGIGGRHFTPAMTALPPSTAHHHPLPDGNDAMLQTLKDDRPTGKDIDVSLFFFNGALHRLAMKPSYGASATCSATDLLNQQEAVRDGTAEGLGSVHLPCSSADREASHVAPRAHAAFHADPVADAGDDALPVDEDLDSLLDLSSTDSLTALPSLVPPTVSPLPMSDRLLEGPLGHHTAGPNGFADGNLFHSNNNASSGSVATMGGGGGGDSTASSTRRRFPSHRQFNVFRVRETDPWCRAASWDVTDEGEEESAEDGPGLLCEGSWEEPGIKRKAEKTSWCDPSSKPLDHDEERKDAAGVSMGGTISPCVPLLNRRHCDDGIPETAAPHPMQAASHRPQTPQSKPWKEEDVLRESQEAATTGLRLLASRIRFEARSRLGQRLACSTTNAPLPTESSSRTSSPGRRNQGARVHTEQGVQETSAPPARPPAVSYPSVHHHDVDDALGGPNTDFLKTMDATDSNFFFFPTAPSAVGSAASGTFGSSTPQGLANLGWLRPGSPLPPME